MCHIPSRHHISLTTPHRPAPRRTQPAAVRHGLLSTRQHSRLVARVAASTETEAEAVVEEVPAAEGGPATAAAEEGSERKSFRKDRSDKKPITELVVGQQLEGTVVCDYGGVSARGWICIVVLFLTAVHRICITDCCTPYMYYHNRWVSRIMVHLWMWVCKLMASCTSPSSRYV